MSPTLTLRGAGEADLYPPQRYSRDATALPETTFSANRETLLSSNHLRSQQKRNQSRTRTKFKPKDTHLDKRITVVGKAVCAKSVEYKVRKTETTVETNRAARSSAREGKHARVRGMFDHSEIQERGRTEPSATLLGHCTSARDGIRNSLVFRQSGSKRKTTYSSRKCGFWLRTQHLKIRRKQRNDGFAAIVLNRISRSIVVGSL